VYLKLVRRRCVHNVRPDGSIHLDRNTYIPTKQLSCSESYLHSNDTRHPRSPRTANGDPLRRPRPHARPTFPGYIYFFFCFNLTNPSLKTFLSIVNQRLSQEGRVLVIEKCGQGRTEALEPFSLCYLKTGRDMGRPPSILFAQVSRLLRTWVLTSQAMRTIAVTHLKKFSPCVRCTTNADAAVGMLLRMRTGDWIA